MQWDDPRLGVRGRFEEAMARPSLSQLAAGSRHYWVGNRNFHFHCLFLFILWGPLTHEDTMSRAARSARREEVSNKEQAAWADADEARKALSEQDRRSWEEAVRKVPSGKDRIEK